MDKNVYSLVLLDEVVDAVDKLAYERNTSRSSLINRILADYLSCPIPENRIRDIFGFMEKMFDDLDNFQFRDQPSDTMITVRSALHYRYRPTVRYVLELYRRCEPEIGELRVSLRTQSSGLLCLSNDFFRFWNGMENDRIGSRFPGGTVPCRIEAGRFTRRLQAPREKANRANEKIAHAILGYICEFDSAMKMYFAGAVDSDDLEAAERELEEQYRDYLKSAVIL